MSEFLAQDIPLVDWILSSGDNLHFNMKAELTDPAGRILSDWK